MTDDEGETMSAMRKVRFLAATAAIGLVLTGCALRSGGGGAGDSTPSAAPGGSAPVAVTELKINKSYWYAGFKVTLGTARIVASSVSGKEAVTIEGVFQNLSPEHSRMPTTTALLVVGDRTYSEVDHPLSELPEVPAQRSQPGSYAFEVDEHFVLADAVLVVGKPSDRQATIPFTGPAGLVALEPRPVPVTGKVLREKTGSVFMTVSAVEVRSDEPLLHGEAPTGQEFLRLAFSATNNTDAGFAWVFDRDLHLILPDGTSIGTADNCSRAQIYPAPHATATGGLACFLVPAPANGVYQLTWNLFQKGALRVPVE
ncbi:hypothetical protein F4553_007102 [Allocatelliglobosispora scoriae]|uniref:Uncharacterized protein n=1 Tax=Allocatelliglobosispora scoriae TaxID=643052 RepID=A0A841C1N6_9ACTN|nr:hypothetical protein [Allocatelliglobosispora scoriae]MBB5873668.1 hypothetical protein [Allocatelliglobosispora scoriae]